MDQVVRGKVVLDHLVRDHLIQDNLVRDHQVVRDRQVLRDRQGMRKKRKHFVYLISMYTSNNCGPNVLSNPEFWAERTLNQKKLGKMYSTLMPGS